MLLLMEFIPDYSWDLSTIHASFINLIFLFFSLYFLLSTINSDGFEFAPSNHISISISCTKSFENARHISIRNTNQISPQNHSSDLQYSKFKPFPHLSAIFLCTFLPQILSKSASKRGI